MERRTRGRSQRVRVRGGWLAGMGLGVVAALSGCASTGDLDALAGRVDRVEASERAMLGRLDALDASLAGVEAGLAEARAEAASANTRASEAERAASEAAERATAAERRADAMFKKTVSK